MFDVPEDHGTVCVSRRPCCLCSLSQMHLSVVDKNHMAVSATSTVNLVFGSRVLDINTGVILNDEVLSALSSTGGFSCGPFSSTISVDQESRSSRPLLFVPLGAHESDSYFGQYPSPCVPPRHWFKSLKLTTRSDNYPESKKRPLSSTCPTVIENADGSLYAVLGASGGLSYSCSLVSFRVLSVSQARVFFPQ